MYHIAAWSLWVLGALQQHLAFLFKLCVEGRNPDEDGDAGSYDVSLVCFLVGTIGDRKAESKISMRQRQGAAARTIDEERRDIQGCQSESHGLANC